MNDPLYMFVFMDILGRTVFLRMSSLIRKVGRSYSLSRLQQNTNRQIEDEVVNDLLYYSGCLR